MTVVTVIYNIILFSFTKSQLTKKLEKIERDQSRKIRDTTIKER